MEPTNMAPAANTTTDPYRYDCFLTLSTTLVQLTVGNAQ
jgi:hypothetical protein